MTSEEVGPVATVAMDPRPDVRYIIRRKGLVLVRPDRPGETVRWVPEDEAGNDLLTFMTDRAAINACAMHCGDDGEVVQQTKEVLQ